MSAPDAGTTLQCVGEFLVPSLLSSMPHFREEPYFIKFLQKIKALEK